MDKAYDSDNICRFLEHQGIEAVIPPKSNRKMLFPYDKTMRELEEFRATLGEEDLARLEQRTAELKRKQKAQMLRMIASLPSTQRREAERQLPMMERAMAHPIEMQALIELEEEQKRAEIAKKSEIRKITVTPVTAEQILEIRQQQKMNQTLEMLEDAARQ